MDSIAEWSHHTSIVLKVHNLWKTCEFKSALSQCGGLRPKAFVFVEKNNGKRIDHACVYPNTIVSVLSLICAVLLGCFEFFLRHQRAGRSIRAPNGKQPVPVPFSALNHKDMKGTVVHQSP